MTKSILKFAVLSLLAVAIAGMPSPLRAQSTNKHAAAKDGKETTDSKAKKPGASTPFHGKLTAVDKVGKTISVGENNLVIQVTSETKISKSEKPAVLDDGVIGENVSGAYKKSDDGKLHATMITFGAKGSTKTKPGSDTATEPHKKTM